jgi:anti-anti-sigma factor
MLSTYEHDRLRIRFEGRLDTAKCEEISAEVRAAVTAPTVPVEFDLAEVDFVASAFLRLCIYAYQQSGEQGLQILNASPTIKRVFKIAGMDKLFKCE